MYSAEIAGDEEDEKEAAKNATLTEEELSAKKAKEAKQFSVASLHNGCYFHSCFCCSFYAASVCTGKPSAQGWCF